MCKKHLFLFLSLMFFIGFTGMAGCGRTSTSNSTPASPYWGANGYSLSPAGVQIGNSSFTAPDRKAIPQPSEMAVTPDGKTALVLSTGWVTYAGKSHMITAIDTATDQIASYISLTTPPLGYESFDGMAVNSSSTDVYIPGIEAQRGYVLDVGIGTGSSLSFKQAIPLKPYITSTFGSPTQVWPTAAGIAVYGNILITANNVAYDAIGNQWPGETVSIIDLSTNTQTFTLTTGGFYPWAVAITPNGQDAYVVNRQSNNGAGTVSVISSLGSTPTVTTIIPLNQVGSAAIISSLNGSKMYVANTLSDTVSVIDTSTNSVTGTISLAMFSTEPSMGGMPNNLALSGDGKYLYVSMGSDNAIAVIDTASDQVVGRIPTAVYPSGVAFDTANNHIFVANMYGVGHGPYIPASYSHVYDFANYAWFCYGSVSDIPQPSTAQLAAYTNQVLNNDFVPTKNPHPPVPANIMSAWSNIKHVIYILRENKTTDMEFGDLGTQANVAPVPCPFLSAGSIYAFSLLPASYGCSNPNANGAGIGFTTPNTHALASQFALDTNFYLDIVPSICGHPSSFQGMISDYLQRIWSINTGYGGKNRSGDSGEPIASVPSGTIFDALKNAGITFSVFGQGMPSIYNGPFNNNNPLNLLPEIDQSYSGNDISDVTKADYFIKNFVQTNNLPDFVFMSLGDDGYEPTDTPIAAYTENDAATAAVVQAISNSKYWGSTAIFIDEDDPQPGFDHIDQERSFIIVVSPYAKHGYISTAHYGFASALRTIEIILSQSTGKTLSPMTEFDATALPMYDMFQATPIMTPFTAMPVTWNSVGWSRN